jgi:hypothetical protein
LCTPDEAADNANLLTVPHLTRYLAGIAHWRTELGLLEQVLFKPNGIDVERNHTLTMSLGYSR